MTPVRSDIPLLSAPFLFLRHGESEANLAEVIAGTLDSPLTDRGHAQAAAAAEKLRGVEIASVWTSRLARAVETARPIAEGRGLPLIRLEGLGERAWGELEDRPLGGRVGGPKAEVAGAEPWEDFVARTWAALGAVAGPFPVCVVAHSGTMRALREGLGIDDDTKIGNAEPVWFGRRGGEWICRPL